MNVQRVEASQRFLESMDQWRMNPTDPKKVVEVLSCYYERERSGASVSIRNEVKEFGSLVREIFQLHKGDDLSNGFLQLVIMSRWRSISALENLYKHKECPDRMREVRLAYYILEAITGEPNLLIEVEEALQRLEESQSHERVMQLVAFSL